MRRSDNTAGNMSNETSELEFFLIDAAGNRRIPYKIKAAHGPYGYAIHPEGKGNDPKAARYTEDLKELVQAVVLHGQGVRAKVKAGPQKGQSNTVSLAKRTVPVGQEQARMGGWCVCASSERSGLLSVPETARTCTKCGSHRFNSWDRCMDCRTVRAKVRQARIKTNGGSHTRAEWNQLLESSPACAVCGRAWEDIPMRPDARYRHTWTKGHMVPVLHGGTDDISNIQAECYECNFRKNAAS